MQQGGVTTRARGEAIASTSTAAEAHSRSSVLPVSVLMETTSTHGSGRNNDLVSHSFVCRASVS